MKKIRLKAMAKINLGLDVVRKREDGYHEVRMIMQTIRMYDQIELEPTEAPGDSGEHQFELSARSNEDKPGIQGCEASDG